MLLESLEVLVPVSVFQVTSELQTRAASTNVSIPRILATANLLRLVTLCRITGNSPGARQS